MTIIEYFTIGLAATAMVVRIALFLPRAGRKARAEQAA
jgi:hypothetical protein